MRASQSFCVDSTPIVSAIEKGFLAWTDSVEMRAERSANEC